MGKRHASRSRPRVPPGRLLPEGVVKALENAQKELGEIGAKTALIGGLAVGARTVPRTTRDVDFAVSVANDREAETIVQALLRRDFQVQATLEHTSGRLATARLTSPADRHVLVDLLFYFCGIEAEIVNQASEIGAYPVAERSHLLATKIIAGRDEDLHDVTLLLAHMKADELRRAKQLLLLAEKRGFNAGRNLRQELKALIARDRAANASFRDNPARTRALRRRAARSPAR